MSPGSLSSRARTLAAWLAAGIVAACGGGVDSGGTGAPTTSDASGPITGFGSVIVDDVHYDDRTAQVRDADGNARSRDDLRLGMTIDVRGSAIGSDADGNPASTASSIVYGSEIVGPVAANDLVARTLTVFGQTVDVTVTTAFDSTLVGGQAALVAGTVVVVYAHLDAASGHYVATRIDVNPGATVFALRGIVAGLDTTARTFSLGAARISYAGLAAASVPATLANGRFVRATLALAPGAGGVWTALGLFDGAPAVEDRAEVKIKGLVSAFTSTTQFSVNGTPVDARAAQFPAGIVGLALGRRVEVAGATVAGVLVATSVTVVSDSQENGREFDVRGTIASLDTVAKTFVVRDVIVSYSGAVDFRDGSAADLAVGRDVEARGTLGAEGTILQATRIDFRH
ncbi:MAG: DUF5666 domain-containing protein [Caldimonas sp.]